MQAEMAALEQEIAALSRNWLKSPASISCLHATAPLDRFAEEGGYEAESRIMGVAQGLAFRPPT